MAAARAGDEAAWDILVDRFAAEVWTVIRRRGLQGPAAADVFLLTWMRLTDRLTTGEPAGLAIWLAETARRECDRMTGVTASIGPGQERATSVAGHGCVEE
jgi:hypothetical protein